MFQCEINGIDLSLDFGYINVLERVEKANENYQKNRYIPVEAQSAAAKVRHYCNEIMAVINEIYEPIHGPNVCDRIFANPQGVNFDAVYGLYHDLLTALGAHGEMQAQRNLDMARETAIQMARTKAAREAFQELNAQNSAASAEQIADINAQNVTRFPGAR